MTLSKWIAVAAGAKKLASRGVMERTLNYLNDAVSITGYVQEISQYPFLSILYRLISPKPDRNNARGGVLPRR